MTHATTPAPPFTPFKVRQDLMQPGQLQNHYIVGHDAEFLIFFFGYLLLSAGIMACDTILYSSEKPRASCLLAKHCTTWAES